MLILLWKVHRASKGMCTLNARADTRNGSGHESGIRFGLAQRCVLKPALVMRFMNLSTIIKISLAKLLRRWKGI